MKAMRQTDEQEGSMQGEVNNDSGPGLAILQAARSLIASVNSAGDQDILRNICDFIMQVLKQAGFDLKKPGGSNYALRTPADILMMDFFNEVGRTKVNPGDILSYLDEKGQKTVGLIESYDPKSKTGSMYALDESTGEVSLRDLTGADSESASFLRADIGLFMGNLAGLMGNPGEDPDDDQYMGPSYYPSPSP